MTEPLEKINKFIPDFKNEVLGIQTSIEKIILEKKIVKPFFIPFDSDQKKPFVSFVRDWNTDNYDDYYSAIVEMIYTFSSVRPSSFILSIHPESNSFFNVNNKFDFDSSNNLIVFVINEDFGVAIELKYSVNFENNTITWHDQFDCTDIADIDDVMVEMLYVFSHIDVPPFEYNEVLNYLSSLNTNVMIVDETSSVNKLYNIKKGMFTPTLII